MVKNRMVTGRSKMVGKRRTRHKKRRMDNLGGAFIDSFFTIRGVLAKERSIFS